MPDTEHDLAGMPHLGTSPREEGAAGHDTSV